jgi:thioredoxin 1
MGPLCIPVYRVAEELEAKYSHVKFYDMEYDNPESYFFHVLPEVHDLEEIPIIIFYRNGKAVKSIAGLKSKKQFIENIEKEYPSL